jgi:hypothetical protein
MPDQGWQLETRHGRIDVLLEGTPPLDFESVRGSAIEAELDGEQVLIADLPHLVAFKRLAGRLQDQAIWRRSSSCTARCRSFRCRGSTCPDPNLKTPVGIALRSTSDDFTTHQARRTLIGWGVPPADDRVANRGPGADGERDHGTAQPACLAERLRSFPGSWVAIKDGDVIHATESPHELVGWLGRNGQKADSMFRVPDDDLATAGLAPL